MALMSADELFEGIASLSRGAYFKEASLDMTFSLLTESAAHVIGVERVSIWALTDDLRELRCLELFERSSGRHSSGGQLSAADYPDYFRSLRETSCIAADDVYEHPAIAELARAYLPQHGITALLETPIYIRGDLQGVLSLEQVGSRQSWTLAHRAFAQAVANLVTLALVEYEAEEARRKARRADERLKLLFDLAREAMLLFDADSGCVLDANPQAEKLFGCRRDELIGRWRRQLYRLLPGKDGDAVAIRSPGEPVAAELRRADGGVRAVTIATEEAEVAQGRRLALEIIRPS
ncbi:MAG: GAF domain-containing protein [Betaproteobacteria bacterium]|nr:GAF domain-containing protein [Betaproteobacteria bacterium]MCL2886649.1 GAF domain-containing protein [Betaproteobacteria bacterium]